jgi:hypothetical protein
MKPMLKIFAKFPRGAILPITQVVASLKDQEQCEKVTAQVNTKALCFCWLIIDLGSECAANDP